MDDLIPAVYRELHAMARGFLLDERSARTLQPTALVHEAYLKLSVMDSVTWHNRAQFFAIAARVLRNILVDHARERKAQKRGAGAVAGPLTEALGVAAPVHPDLDAVDESLARLGAIDERKARVVELRYFAGLSVEETAEALECSPTTVKREWAFARAWLYRDLCGSKEP